MGEFTSSPWEQEMTQAEIQALIDASMVANIDSTTRGRLTRNYSFEADLPDGKRSGGADSSFLLRPPLISLTAGQAAATNKIEEHCEKTLTLFDFTKSHLGSLGFWRHKHYAHCILSVISVTGVAATNYVGLELSGMFIAPPWPIAPASYGGAQGQIVHVRADTSTGAWNLFQDNGSVSKLTSIPGNALVTAIPALSRVEITYNPGVSIVVGIDGLYTTVSGANLIIDPDGVQPGYGMGIFTTTGTTAGVFQTVGFAGLHGYSELEAA